MGQFVSKAYVRLDGVPLLKSATLNIEMQDGNTDVETINGGFEGHTKGSAKYVIKIGSPIPEDGMEVDLFALVKAGETHNVDFVILRPPEAGGGVLKELNLEGDFRAPSAGFGVNKAADTDVSFHGRDLL